VQLALYDPEVNNNNNNKISKTALRFNFHYSLLTLTKVDLESSGSALFAPPWTPFKIFEIIFMFLFPTEAALKLYAYQRAYFGDFWNKIDFFCVLLIFVNLVPGLPNLTVIRTLRMLKPLRSIARLPTLKVIVTTLVRSAQQIIDVYVICFFVFLVFAVLAMDLFGGAFAQTCLSITEACTSDGAITSESMCPKGNWEIVSVVQQPDSLTAPQVDRRCGVYDCEEGYKCYLGNADEFNPEGGAQSFDSVGMSLLTVFILVTRKGWVRILSKLWDTYGYVAPTFIALVLMMFGSYLLTQLVTAAITVTYEKVDDEMYLEILKQKEKNKLDIQLGRKPAEESESESDSDDDDLVALGAKDKEPELGPDGLPVEKKKKRKKKDAYQLALEKKQRAEQLRPGLLGKLGFKKRKTAAQKKVRKSLR
jgi:voltage-dependent calcium channel L type alpha-1C/voltage-dependent calcium channel L type alpha-1D